MQKQDFKYKVALVFDYGSYFEVAIRLSEEFGKVYYYCPYVTNGFPEHSPVDIGRNVPNVERVLEWATIIENVDIVIFCDAHEADLQDDFRKRGKIVFGSGANSELEHDKIKLKHTLEEVGLPVGDYWEANGIDELEQILKTNDDAYVKATLRGDSETWKHKKWILSKGEILRMRKQVGIFDTQERYLVDKTIDSIAEIGYDGFCVDGMYPEKNLTGVELKDTGYLGVIMPYKDMPKQIRAVNDKLAPIFKQNNYRGALSTEVMIDKKLRGYLLDLTTRFPQPPTSLYLQMYKNFPQIVWDISRGAVPTIEYEFEFGVELIIYSDIAETDPSPIIVPDEVKDYVKIKNLVIDEEGTWYYTPMGIKMKQIGACIGMGHSMEEATKNAVQVSEAIEGFDTYVNTDCLEKANDQFKKLKRAGIKYI